MLIAVLSPNVAKCRERPHDEYQNPPHYSFHRRRLLREDARRRWTPFSRILLNWIVC